MLLSLLFFWGGGLNLTTIHGGKCFLNQGQFCCKQCFFLLNIVKKKQKNTPPPTTTIHISYTFKWLVIYSTKAPPSETGQTRYGQLQTVAMSFISTLVSQGKRGLSASHDRKKCVNWNLRSQLARSVHQTTLAFCKTNLNLITVILCDWPVSLAGPSRCHSLSFVKAHLD